MLQCEVPQHSRGHTTCSRRHSSVCSTRSRLANTPALLLLLLLLASAVQSLLLLLLLLLPAPGLLPLLAMPPLLPSRLFLLLLLLLLLLWLAPLVLWFFDSAVSLRTASELLPAPVGLAAAAGVGFGVVVEKVAANCACSMLLLAPC
jgi:hypothetical protein